MEFFYDGQVRRYLTQFMRVMSNFSYKDSKGNLVQVPVRYGDMSRQVAQIINKNSENIMQSAPFIACYIKDIQYDRERLQDPTYISKVNVRERAKNADGTEYLNTQGANYTVERIMPSPFKITFSADIWTTNTEQKFQIWEQIVVLFNPALEIQTTDNFLDWTSLSYLELGNLQFESRTVPQGLESDISVCNMTFNSPIWITPPAKVKKLGIITKIIASIFNEPPGTIGTASSMDLADLYAGQVASAKTVITPNDYDLLVLDGKASLLPIKQSNTQDSIEFATDIKNRGNWNSLIGLYPGEFKAGLSQIRLSKPNGGEIVAFVSLDPTDDFSMYMSYDNETVPTTDFTISAIVNPQTFTPTNITAATRYLILEDILHGTTAWNNADTSVFTANANDVIEWDGDKWSIIFNSATVTNVTYITNSYTGVQYKWDGAEWSKSYEGVYDKGSWRLIL